MAQGSGAKIEKLKTELALLRRAGKLTHAAWDQIMDRAYAAVGDDDDSSMLDALLDAEPPPDGPADIAELQRISQELESLHESGKLTHAKWEKLLKRAKLAANGQDVIEFVLNMRPAS